MMGWDHQDLMDIPEKVGSWVWNWNSSSVSLEFICLPVVTDGTRNQQH